MRNLRNWRIEGPTGDIINSGTVNSITHTFAFTPSLTENHKIIFDGLQTSTLTSASQVGPFTYTLTPAIDAPLNTRISGALQGGRDTDLYAVDGQAGRSITVSAYWGDTSNGNDGALDTIGRRR